jgi:hypothetical protein
VHPENWKRGRKYNKERMWIAMVYHEMGHYLFWTDAERKADAFAVRMVRGLRRTRVRPRVRVRTRVRVTRRATARHAAATPRRANSSPKRANSSVRPVNQPTQRRRSRTGERPRRAFH